MFPPSLYEHGGILLELRTLPQSLEELEGFGLGMCEAGGGLHHIDELRDQEHAPETRYDYDEPTEVRDRIEVSEANYKNECTNLYL